MRLRNAVAFYFGIFSKIHFSFLYEWYTLGRFYFINASALIENAKT